MALTDAELDRALDEHHGWHREGDAIVRQVTFRDFPEALGFIERVGQAAVDYDRRPDMCILENNHVRLSIRNLHHLGFTLAELRLAAKVNAILDEG
jgi:4a-hydroxytetrahydrobiopterin dehydratase